MSTTLRIVLVMKLLPLLLSAYVLRSDQSNMSLESFKTSVNITYDCIDIYKQPGLDNPLLKNHKIQMKPSISISELKNQSNNHKTFTKKKTLCPKGTVPILKNTKEFITNSEIFDEKYFNPVSLDSPGTHIAGVRSLSGPFRGVIASTNGYVLNVQNDQASYSQIYIGSGLNNRINFISAGWMTNPSVFGYSYDRIWTYGFWKGKGDKGCYNTACPGFIQVSHTVPIAEASELDPGVPIWMRISIHQDKNTGNWWITQVRKNEPNIDIGYWPKELFNLLDNGAIMAGVGGVVQNSHSGESPSMGNGKYPNENIRESAIFTNIDVFNSNYEQRNINSFPIETLLDSPICYGLRTGTATPLYRTLGYFFNYGGSGGINCGI